MVREREMVNSKSLGQSAGRGSEKKQLIRLDAHKHFDYIPPSLNGPVASQQIQSPLEKKVDSSKMRVIVSHPRGRPHEDVYNKSFSSTDDQQVMGVPPKALKTLGVSVSCVSPVSTFIDGEEEEDDEGLEDDDEGVEDDDEGAEDDDEGQGDITFVEDYKKNIGSPSPSAKGQKGEDSYAANGARQPAADDSAAIELNPGATTYDLYFAAWNHLCTAPKGPRNSLRGPALSSALTSALTSAPTGHVSTPSSPNHDSVGASSQYAPRAVSLPTSPENGGEFPWAGASPMLNTRSNPGSPSNNGRLPMGGEQQSKTGGGRPTSPRPQQLPPPPLMSKAKSSHSPRQNQNLRTQPSPIFGEDGQMPRVPLSSPASSFGNPPSMTMPSRGGANFTAQVPSPHSHATMLPRTRHPTKPLPPASPDGLGVPSAPSAELCLFPPTRDLSSPGTSSYPLYPSHYPPHPPSPPTHAPLHSPVTYPGVPLHPPSPPSSEDVPFRSSWSFTKGRVLGSGAFGTVYEAMTPDGKFCAVKELDMSAAVGTQDARHALASLKQEVELLKQLQHPNIVQYYGTLEEDTKLYIFLECVSKGSIQNVLSLYSRLDESQIRNYTRQILEGIKYLHEHETIHRDIKCANVLVDHSGVVKLADFGMARVVHKDSLVQSMRGTPYWMAPEVIQPTEQGYSWPADIWSLGCTVLEMADGKPPWSDSVGFSFMFKITTGEIPPIPQHLSAEADDFIRQCLKKNPSERPSAEELLTHPFVLNSEPDMIIPRGETPPPARHIAGEADDYMSLSGMDSLDDGSLEHSHLYNGRHRTEEVLSPSSQLSAPYFSHLPGEKSTADDRLHGGESNVMAGRQDLSMSSGRVGSVRTRPSFLSGNGSLPSSGVTAALGVGGAGGLSMGGARSPWINSPISGPSR